MIQNNSENQPQSVASVTPRGQGVAPASDVPLAPLREPHVLRPFQDANVAELGEYMLGLLEIVRELQSNQAASPQNSP